MRVLWATLSVSLPITNSKSETFFRIPLKPLEWLEVGLWCWPTLESDSLGKATPLQNAKCICRHWIKALIRHDAVHCTHTCSSKLLSILSTALLAMVHVNWFANTMWNIIWAHDNLPMISQLPNWELPIISIKRLPIISKCQPIQGLSINPHNDTRGPIRSADNLKVWYDHSGTLEAANDLEVAQAGYAYEETRRDSPHMQT